jgi:16S rRNA (guanine966-N2)-methyltransferase
MIRIIGGVYKHRLIDQPPMEITRCTKDMAKEGLFNSLGDIEGKSFLDLFSGSGSIAIEAYSRGARPVYLNDENREAKRTIMRNLLSLGIFDANVYGLKDVDCLKDISTNKKITFDIIFLDPPYVVKVTSNYLNSMKELKVADNNTLFIIESDVPLDMDDFKDYNVKVLKYGRSMMNLLRSK